MGYEIDTLRHSTAHLMAHAISRLFPQEKPRFGVGPTIENGFYYDVEMAHKLTDEDLTKIEAEMQKIISERIPVTRKELSKSDAVDLFEKLGQTFKVELIRDLPEGEIITCYEQGDFVDLCRGPHVITTAAIPQSFKLTQTAGAYWRGDSNRPMLQRIYALSFSDKKELKEHLHFLEEAKKRDHRKLGNELNLFHFSPEAPASPFFMPKGAFLYNRLVNFLREVYVHYGYQEVITPQLLDSELWKTSGHYDNYRENMYFSEVDEKQFALKPMNCPTHMLMFKHHKYSYRDLPLRFADFGRLHRNEKSGTLAGLTRVRTFSQDDGHIFIELTQIEEEIERLIDMFFTIYGHFKFDKIKINLSTRPPKRVGAEESWDMAESALKKALDKSGMQYHIKEGDGAFYGPKIDIEIADALNRYFQLGTIQLDFQLPDRFDLKYTAQTGELKQPVVIHRALLGSLERFLGIYIEHVGGAFPFWLAPLQVTIIPVNNEMHLSYCEELLKKFKRLGIRTELNDKNESLGYKTRETQHQKIPFMIVIGDKEIAGNNVNIRAYGEKQGNTISMDELLLKFKTLNDEKLPVKLR